jgi:hypothetical protein
MLACVRATPDPMRHGWSLSFVFFPFRQQFETQVDGEFVYPRLLTPACLIIGRFPSRLADTIHA